MCLLHVCGWCIFESLKALDAHCSTGCYMALDARTGCKGRCRTVVPRNVGWTPVCIKRNASRHSDIPQQLARNCTYRYLVYCLLRIIFQDPGGIDCRQSRCQCSRSASLALTLTISTWFLVSLTNREAWLQNARSQRRPNRSGLNRSG